VSNVDVVYRFPAGKCYWYLNKTDYGYVFVT